MNCEECALKNTNEAFRAMGVKEADSMDEAAAYLELLNAMAGRDEEFLAASEYGQCEECGKAVQPMQA